MRIRGRVSCNVGGSGSDSGSGARAEEMSYGQQIGGEIKTKDSFRNKILVKIKEKLFSNLIFFGYKFFIKIKLIVELVKPA